MYYPELQQRITELEKFRALLDQAPDEIVLADSPQGYIIYANAAALRRYHNPSGLTGVTLNEWLHLPVPLDFPASPDANSLTAPISCLLGCPQGGYIQAEISTSIIQFCTETYWAVIIRDISERKRLQTANDELYTNYQQLASIYCQLISAEDSLRHKVVELEKSQAALAQSEARYRLATEGVNDAIWDWDIVSDYSFISEHWAKKLGLPQSTVKNYRSLWPTRVHPDDNPLREKAIHDCVTGESAYLHLEYRFLVPPEQWIWLQVKGKVLFDDMGNPVRMAGSLTDITAQKQQAAFIHHLAYHDFLTGLPNRLSLYKNLNAALRQATEENLNGALFLLDLDNFKFVNDSLGHAFGDELLMEVSRRLVDALPSQAITARLGGDEFVISLFPVLAKDINVWAQKILSLFDKPALLNGTQLALASSIGVARFSGAATVDEVIRNADMALHQAKAAGKKTWCIYKPEMQAAMQSRMQMENELHQALAASQLCVYYQPQIELASRQTIAWEALLRWSHPTYGLVSPQTFIPLAEETGLIIPIGDAVLRYACQFGRQFHPLHQPPPRISINVSARQIIRDDFTERFQRILREENFSPEYLELEVTETILMESFEENIRKLTILREQGVRITLDDFGTGYSSLSYLSRLPVDSLKIDKSFIQDMANSPTAATIVQTIILLAKQMKLTVVAEGVETSEQMQFLRNLDCDYVQGFLISHPLPAFDALKLAQNQTK